MYNRNPIAQPYFSSIDNILRTSAASWVRQAVHNSFLLLLLLIVNALTGNDDIRLTQRESRCCANALAKKEHADCGADLQYF